MKRILTLSVCLFVYASLASAQKFMEQIEQVAEGQGTVKIYQDALLTKIINGEFIPTEEPENDDNNSRMRVKRRGYRIQVFKGGNTRTDEAEARKAGEKIKRLFKLEAYTIYNNPEWVCRVGDFKNRDEALEYLNKVRAVSRSAMIVPSEIYVKE